MPERTLEAFEWRGPKPRTVGLIAILLIVFIILWGTFVIVPAGHRGVVLWWGGVPILVQYKSIEKWNGILPQVTGGAMPLIDLGKSEGWLGGNKK